MHKFILISKFAPSVTSSSLQVAQCNPCTSSRHLYRALISRYQSFFECRCKQIFNHFYMCFHKSLIMKLIIKCLRCLNIFTMEINCCVRLDKCVFVYYYFWDLLSFYPRWMRYLVNLHKI